METLQVECVECRAEFNPDSEGQISDSPHLGSFVIAFCGKCWKTEAKRRGLLR